MRVLVEAIADAPPGTVHGWRDLATIAAEPNPFSEPAIAVAAAQHLEGGAEAGLLTVSSDDRIVLAAPVVRLRRFRRIPLPAMSVWHHEQSSSGTPLVDPDRAHDAWAAVLDHVRAERLPWLVLDTVHDGGPATAPLYEVLAARHRAPHPFDAYPRPIVARRSEATYTEGRLSSSHRKKLRRLRRGLATELGEDVGTVDLLADASSADAAVSAFLDLEASGWKGRAGTALASRSGDAEFFRQACAALHAERRLQILRFGTSERPAALACNVVASDTLFNFKVSYDEDLGRFSPGRQLELDMLDEFHADTRLDVLDSCTDADNDIVNQLYPDRRPMATLLVAPSDPRGRVAAALTPVVATAFRRTRRAAYRLLRRTPPSDRGRLT